MNAAAAKQFDNDFSVPLTANEEQELVHLEDVVRRGLQTFVEVGLSLGRIRDGRLYRQVAQTFEAYCELEFGLTRQRVHQVIAAAGITWELSTMVDTPLPSNERQARELIGLSVGDAAAVLVTAAQAGPITAAGIKAARHGSGSLEPEPWFDSPEEAAASDAMGDLSDAEFDRVLLHARADGDMTREHVVDLALQVTAARQTHLLDVPAATVTAARRRRALSDAYADNVFELGKIVSSIQRLHRDNRWAANRTAVVHRNRGDLQRLLGVFEGIVAEILEDSE